MEHLLSEGDGLTAPISVPYLSSDFDGEDFLSFPDRRGWDIAIWQWVPDNDQDTAFLPEGRTYEDMAAFLQSWLFFGLLQVIMLESIDVEKFKHSAKTDSVHPYNLTTAALPGYLRQREESLKTLHSEARREYDEKLDQCLQKASGVNNNLNYMLYYGEPRQGSEVLQQTIFAQQLLVEVLENLNEDVDTFTTRGGLTYDAYLKRSMLDAGWCPSSVDFMQQSLPLQLQVYAFASGSVRTLADHSECTEWQGCKKLQAGEGFKTKHVSANCNCNMVPAPIDDVVSCLRRGKIPVFAITGGTEAGDALRLLVDGIDLDDPDFPISCPFVAFSHVWADGLGNPDSNALPTCQLLRLRRILSSLKTEDESSFIEVLSAASETTASQHNTIPFWFDSLSIPVQPEHQALRNFSIDRMREIYRRATGVVVLDPDLLSLNRDAKRVDVMVRALSSGWRGRLWTYQEASLANSLHLAVEDHCFAFDEFFLEDDHSAFVRRVTDGDIVQGQLLWISWRRYSDLIWDSLAASYATENNAPRALKRMLMAVSHRSTTRAGDETICLATFIKMNVQPLLSAAQDERMPIFLSQLGEIPPDVLFTYGEHCKAQGFRWASDTFLLPGGVRESLNVVYPKEYTDDQGNEHPVPKPRMHPGGLGVSLFLSAIEFTLTEPKEASTFKIDVPNKGIHQVEAQDSGSMSDWVLSSPTEGTGSRTFVVLLMDSEYCSLGILAEVDAAQQSDEGGPILCHWRRIVEVFGEEETTLSVPVEDEFMVPGRFVEFRDYILD